MERYVWKGPGTLTSNGNIFDPGRVFDLSDVPSAPRLEQRGLCEKIVTRVLTIPSVSVQEVVVEPAPIVDEIKIDEIPFAEVTLPEFESSHVSRTKGKRGRR